MQIPILGTSELQIRWNGVLALAKKQLNPGGQVWFEINERMGEGMQELCHEMGFPKAEVLEDFAGKTRFVKTWTAE